MLTGDASSAETTDRSQTDFRMALWSPTPVTGTIGGFLDETLNHKNSRTWTEREENPGSDHFYQFWTPWNALGYQQSSDLSSCSGAKGVGDTKRTQATFDVQYDAYSRSNG